MELEKKLTVISHIENEIKDLMTLATMPSDQIKRTMDINYLQLLIESNPSLERKYFVDFISKCQLTGADPRLNQIYLISYNGWNHQAQKTELKGTTVFSYQYFIRLAQQTGQLEDFDVETKEDIYIDFTNQGRKKQSLTAYAWARRKGQGVLKYKARLWEFAKTDKAGNLQGNWKASTYLMLEKCAIANVMRWAFPEVLGGMYIKDEMEKTTGTDHIEIERRNVELIGRTGKPNPAHEPKIDDDKINVIYSHEEIEIKKNNLINIILGMDESFFESIKKDRSTILEKINNETDMKSLDKMEQFINSHKVNL